MGISGTPVVDSASGTMFLVATTKETGSGSVQYVHRLHALDVSSGAERPGSPIVIQATYPGTGEGGKTLIFNARGYKQRPGLLLLNGVVYAGFSSHCDGGKYHGWIMAYDTTTLRQVGVYNSTPNGNEGSFWSGGAAPAADAAGNIYVVSANGAFDAASGGLDLGESYIKLSGANGLSVLDYFAPFNQAVLNDQDVDTGSAGVALLDDEAGSPAHPHLMAGAGKEGRIYLLDRDNLGKWQANSDSQIVQSLPGAISALFGNPAYFNKTLYFCGPGDTLKAFPVNNAQMPSTPSSTSPEPYGYPGCVPSISANGASNGIVWALQPAGVLAGYDASNLRNELFLSNANPQRDALGNTVKFSAPTITNGKVYAGTQDALAVYGLLPQGSVSLAVANAASALPNGIAPGAIATLYGTGLAAGTAAANEFPIPKALAGATVTVNGTAAPVLYASPTQVNFQVPFEATPGAATVSLSVNGSVAGSITIPLFTTAPGIFLESNGDAAVVNQDGSINSASQPAPAGTVVSAWLTGLGLLNPALPSGAAAPTNPPSTVSGVTATVGGVPATIQFAGGAPGFAGVYQVNVQIPPLEAGSHDLRILSQGANSNAATVYVQ
jgi:uncharacterized protein (TIGR03437 family)